MLAKLLRQNPPYFILQLLCPWGWGGDGVWNIAIGPSMPLPERLTNRRLRRQGISCEQALSPSFHPKKTFHYSKVLEIIMADVISKQILQSCQ